MKARAAPSTSPALRMPEHSAFRFKYLQVDDARFPIDHIETVLDDEVTIVGRLPTQAAFKTQRSKDIMVRLPDSLLPSVFRMYLSSAVFSVLAPRHGGCAGFPCRCAAATARASSSLWRFLIGGTAGEEADVVGTAAPFEVLVGCSGTGRAQAASFLSMAVGNHAGQRSDREVPDVASRRTQRRPRQWAALGGGA